MKLLTECRMLAATMLVAVPVLSQAQGVESNPLHVKTINEGTKKINDSIKSQQKGQQNTAIKYQG